MIKFFCYACGGDISVRDTSAGKKAKCAKCGAINKVPGDSKEGTRAPEQDAIRFFCYRCGKKLAAPSDAAGKKARCHHCGAACDVPEADTARKAEAKRVRVIRFFCYNCGQKMVVGLESAGKRVQCPKCKALNRVKKKAGEGAEKAVAEPQKKASGDTISLSGLINMEPESAKSSAPILDEMDKPEKNKAGDSGIRWDSFRTFGKS